MNTIGELMGFKLAAYTNKERFIRLMADAGVLKRGKFEIKGTESDYYVNTENFTTNIHLAKLGEFFADLIMEAHLDFDCIVGMAYHGISFAAATATILANKYGITVNYCSDRKVPDSRGRNICGHTLEDVVALVAIVDRGDGAKFMKEKYDAKTLTVITGDDISNAIERGIV